jgi:predicted double-glycine peptidase
MNDVNHTILKRSLVTAAGFVMAVAAADVTAEPADHRGVKHVRSFLELRQEEVILQKWDISCGAAALATVLNYQHGEEMTEQYVAETMLEGTDSELVRQRLGFSLLDLKRFADSHGYEGNGFGDMTLPDLIEFGPAIVPVHIHTYDHFVVFRGIRDDRVLLADPGYGNRTMSIREFEEIWQNRVAFVVTRTDGTEAPDRLSAETGDFNLVSRAAIRTVLAVR